MKRDKADWAAYCLMAVIIITLWAVVETVVNAAKAHAAFEQERQVKIQGWTPPPIPQCDKALWDRIREGCDE